MKTLILTTTALALTAGAALADAHSVIRMGTEGAYAPWNFLDDNGEVAGFERELGDELCARAELTCEWVTNDWDSIIPNLLSGNYDTIIAGMSITASREEVIDFSTNYTDPDPSAYLARSVDADIKGGMVAAQVNTIQASFVTEMAMGLIEFPTPEDTVAAVRNGEADAVLADCAYLKPIAEDDPDLVLLEKTEMIGGGVGMGFRESDAELRETFNAAIESMKADGSLDALIAKWGIAAEC